MRRLWLRDRFRERANLAKTLPMCSVLREIPPDRAPKGRVRARELKQAEIRQSRAIK